MISIGVSHTGLLCRDFKRLRIFSLMGLVGFIFPSATLFTAHNSYAYAASLRCVYLYWACLSLAQLQSVLVYARISHGLYSALHQAPAIALRTATHVAASNPLLDSFCVTKSTETALLQ